MLADTVIALLKEEISSTEYDRYIKQLKFSEKASNSDQMVFIAPNTLIANWIKTRYCEKLSHLFELKTGKKPEIKIILKEHIKSTKSKSASVEIINDSIKSTKSTILNPSYTFDSFVVGSSNQYAYTAAKSIAEKPGSESGHSKV